jgi:hypothetical protein
MRILRLLLRLARELSDEAGYQRYLASTGRPPSPEAWRTFIDHRHARKYQNAKCC